MKCLVILILLWQPPLEIDLLKIAGKPRAEVEKELGPSIKSEIYTPDESSDCKCERVYYLKGEISITYNSGKADKKIITSQVNILNLHIAKIKAYHKYPDYHLIKAMTLKEIQCCEVL